MKDVPPVGDAGGADGSVADGSGDTMMPTDAPPGVDAVDAAGCVQNLPPKAAWWKGEMVTFDSTQQLDLGGMSQYTMAKVGQGFLLTGINNLSAKFTSSPPGDFTIEGWIKVDGSGAQDRYIIDFGSTNASQEDGWGLKVSLTNVNFYVTGIGVLAHPWSSSLVHVAAVFGQQYMKLYVNGIEEDAKSFPTAGLPMLNQNGVVHVGWPARASAPSSAHFQGTVDELTLYKAALSPAQIVAIFQADFYGKCN